MVDQPRRGDFVSKHDELILEKFFNEYITIWYREKSLSPVQYDKARKEIDILKDKKKKAGKKSNEITPVVRQLPPSTSDSQGDDGRRPKSGRKKNTIPVSSNQGAKDRTSNDETQNKHDATLKLQNEDLKQKINHLKNKIYQLRSDAHCEIKEKDEQIEKMKILLENLREQNNDLSNRLSKLAGDKLRQGNPDLADLSDRYRPTEIGKMFSEVYDNEWSDAFENIRKLGEDKKVGVLHGIVTKAFQFCEQKLNEQTMIVGSVLLGIEGDLPGQESQGSQILNTTVRMTNLLNTLKGVRKEMALETAGNLTKEFATKLEQFVRGFSIKPEEIDKTLRTYASKCVELCWLMVICDPPMALSEDKIGTPYDTNIYKPYTKSIKDMKNPVVSLSIWPALRLYTGGSLVAKGVAQPGEG